MTPSRGTDQKEKVESDEVKNAVVSHSLKANFMKQHPSLKAVKLRGSLSRDFGIGNVNT
jgi:hypothetical protein